jgi:outer membrane protein
MQDALARARKNSVVYQGAVTDANVAREDKNLARDALLPTVTCNNSAIYSQGIGRPPAVRFIANNAVHEYLSQGNAHEVLDVASFAELRRAGATAAAARARAEIATRGLVVTVTRSYYAAAAARQRLDVSQKAADEGERFFKLTQDLENGGEVAHSDVIKAELQANDRRRNCRRPTWHF